MTPEAQAYWSETMDLLVDVAATSSNMLEAGDWIERLEVVSASAKAIGTLRARLHEFRRAYGTEVDEALINRCIGTVEAAESTIPALLDQIVIGLRTARED